MPGTPKTTSAKATKYEMLSPLIAAMLSDFQELTKKKSDAIVSASKVKIVNRLLTDVFELLKEEPTRAYLDLLDADDLPQNSDVMLILGQVKAALDAFRSRYYGWDGYETRWFT